jgi:hypothetical protein
MWRGREWRALERQVHPPILSGVVTPRPVDVRREVPILAAAPKPAQPPWWAYLPPYLRKLVVEALARGGTHVDWPTK